MKTLPIILAIVATFSYQAAAQSQVSKKEVALADCPVAVQDTIKANLGKGTLDDIEAVTRDGSTLYKAEVDLPGDDDLKLYISEQGSLVKTVTEVPLSALPAAGQDALKALATGTDKIEDTEKHVEGDKTSFQAEIDRENGPDLKVVLDQNGVILSQKEKP